MGYIDKAPASRILRGQVCDSRREVDRFNGQLDFYKPQVVLADNRWTLL
jgi:hypothetical protein